MDEVKTEEKRPFTVDEAKAYNAGYMKGCRDTIKMYTDLGVSLSADVLSLERKLMDGEKQSTEASKTEEKASEKE